KRLSLTGLVIGSMSPDFEYFLRMRIQSDYSHTHLGVFLFDLPISLLVAFVVHNIIKNCFIEYSPSFVKSKLYHLKNFNWNNYFIKNWFIVILSIVIGAYSHLLWDSFTHDTGYFVQEFSFLQSDIMNIPVLKIFQHSSTFLGGLLIAYYLMKLPQEKSLHNTFLSQYWMLIGICSLLILFLKVTFSNFNIVIG